jgi:flavin-dependent dehydrogenase
MADLNQVIVVGGGPAGLAAAIALRGRNLNVTVVDASESPIEKVCGEGLLPETLESLRLVGVDPASLTGIPFRGVRYLANSGWVQANFAHGHALGIRRAELHRSLLAAAANAGAEFLWNTRVTGLNGNSVRAAGKSMRADWIIGADGYGSIIRKWAELDAGSSSPQRFAFRQHFRVKPWTDLLEVYWSARGQAYVTVVGAEEICVVVMSRDAHLRIDLALDDFPALAKKLQGSAIVDRERGAVSCNRVLRRVTRGRIALVGDASGTVDAITGEGLGLAFRHARAVADAVARGDLKTYEAAHRKLRRKPQFMARMLLAMDRSPAVQKRAMSIFRAHPAIFEQLLSVHTGKVSICHIAGSGLELGWSLLTA